MFLLQHLEPEGDQTRESFPLRDAQVVGRSSSADIRVDEGTVSTRHARIFKREGRLYLADLESTNGTYLNGRPVQKPVALQPGDLIELGTCRLRLAYEEKEAKPAHPTWSDEDEVQADQSVLVRVDATDPVAGLVEGTTNVGREGSREIQVASLRQRLEQLYSITRAIGQTLDEQELLELVLRKLFALLTHVDRGVILVYDRPGGELATVVSRDRKWKEAEVPVSRTIIGEVVSGRHAILSLDPQSDERFVGSQTVDSLRFRSVVCVPLMSHGEVHGVIQVDSAAKRKKRLTEDDMALIVGVAGQAALSLTNARLHRRLLRQELLKQDLELARRIQSNFLPRELPKSENCRFAIEYEPALEVGGDFYAFLELADGQVGVAIGDVSGKGVSAALYMAKLTSDVRYLSVGSSSVSEIVARLNRSFCRDAEDGMFATLALVKLEAGGRRISLANAGHLAPWLQRADGTVEKLEATRGLALGVDEDWRYETLEVEFGVGDALLLYTDGLVEALDDRDELFGEERSLAVVRDSPDDVEGKIEALSRAVRSFSSRQADDLTLVAISRVS